MAGRLDGQVAIVTGGDSGIGRGIATVFAEAGADVAVTWHNDEAGARETQRLVEQAGRRGLARRTDVRDQRAVAELIDAVAGGLGVPFILVNAAGVGGGDAPVGETPGDDWDRVIRTNLYGPFYCARAFVQARKREGGRGKVINITSVHEATPSPDSAAYGASKGGLLNFTRSLALEVAKDRINVNAIAPGLIKTPMTARRVEDPQKLAEAERHIPWGRAGEPADVAHLALYLASPEADYVTGQSFTVDGGLELDWGQGA
jgi:glucose 1-dehydrogenase